MFVVQRLPTPTYSLFTLLSEFSIKLIPEKNVRFFFNMSKLRQHGTVLVLLQKTHKKKKIQVTFVEHFCFGKIPGKFRLGCFREKNTIRPLHTCARRMLRWNGKGSSTLNASLLKRLTIRPEGVTSKKHMAFPRTWPRSRR